MNPRGGVAAGMQGNDKQKRKQIVLLFCTCYFVLYIYRLSRRFIRSRKTTLTCNQLNHISILFGFRCEGLEFRDRHLGSLRDSHQGPLAQFGVSKTCVRRRQRLLRLYH